MQRRGFMKAAVVGAGSVALTFTLGREALAYPAQSGASPYGGLQAADANGLMLPKGFTSRVVARSGQVVGATKHVWHGAPDGGACFADGSGWIYVSNAELGKGAGGVSAVKFDGAGNITGAYPILSGTTDNCAGGASPWNTWISCEEHNKGLCWETDPWGVKPAVSHEAMGVFNHEAAAFDPDRKVVYLTEDEPDGGFYRYTPNAWGNLSAGKLEVLTTDLNWAAVKPKGQDCRKQVNNMYVFNGGEGAYYRNNICYFTTKGDDKVWAYNAATNQLATVYDNDTTANAPLTGVDNITGDPHVGDLFVAEDGGDMEICVITPNDVIAPFVKIVGQDGSEIAGVAFNPAGTRMYFSSQNGTTGTDGGGITYEVTGPFRRSL
ncbi:dTDP-glucose 4,6-dehydratase [Nocardia camponoti]|uniref:dTDP-glucose 4,6-dehydratase n=2 Tax=Nocardia camponoti TaxID=1616106 RepID=A0A917QIT0_9NOCA|nr:dTDP-glucose 4,6-dehydratase [Nocardia camponoti]